MFSRRVPSELAPNRLARAVAERRASGATFVDLTQSNPTRAGIDYPHDALSALASRRALVYEPHPFGLAEARRAVADDYARQGIAIDPDQVVLTASTSEAYSLVFKLLADPGDEVLIPRPSYPLFEHLARLDAVATRSYDLEYHGAWSIDMTSVAAAVTPRTRALVVVSPNNPTGSCITDDELTRLIEICAPRSIAIVADEVFADYPLDAADDRSGARGGARVSARTEVLAFAFGGLSKSVGLPQAKLGWIAVSGPPAVREAALARLDVICDTYLSVATPVQVAAPELLTRGATVRAHIRERIAANYRTLMATAAGGPCTVLRADAGWSAVVQVPSLQPEEDLVVDLLDKDGVLVHPGYFFDFRRESFVVVSLLPQSAAFGDGIRRLVRHFDCSTAVR